MAESHFLRRLFCYTLCGLGLGYCSAAPSYLQLPADTALLRLSMTIAGTRLHDCRPLSAEALARLPPNMRRPEVCPRERASVQVRLLVDGEPLVDQVLAPRGIARDGAATIYRRIPLAAGSHRIEAGVSEDARRGRFEHTSSRTIDLASGQVLVVDFDRKSGGVTFR